MSIIVKLQGGLGNQLFQYAAGRAFSIYKNTNLKLDLDFFAFPKQNTPRTYALNAFSIQASIATAKDIEQIKPNILNRSIQYLLPYYRRTFLNEQCEFCYDPNILKCRGNVYLSGYFQSEKYFKHIEETIKADFTLKDAPNSANSFLLQKIKASNSVAIHIRHGDYVSNNIINSYHGVCNLEYYEKAVNHIATETNLNYFIFSDDPNWCKLNLGFLNNQTIIDCNQLMPHEDLRLMSHCKHFIIANSTFSWWGAWLSLNPTKIVIAPKRWLNVNTQDLRDLFPSNWILI